MDADKDEMLFNFQAVSGMDIGECLGILEAHNWDWEKATQSVVGNQNFDQNGSDVGINTTAIPAPASENLTAAVMDSSPPPAATTENPIERPRPSRSRLLTFNIEYRDRDIPVCLLDSEPVARIKEVLCGELGIPAEMMQLRGLGKTRTVADNVLLRELHLPSSNRIFLLTPDLTSETKCKAKDDSLLSEDTEEYQLNITHQTDSTPHRSYKLSFPANKTIAEVKSDMDCLLSIPVRRQDWSGWPVCTDHTMLSDAGLTLPQHSLTVKALPAANTPPTSSETVALSSDESDVEMWESHDASEDAWTAASRTPSQEPLLPEDVDDEEISLQHLNRVFAERYGEVHPCFYLGSLEDCVKDSLLCPTPNRRPLCVYLHHDGSIQANIFCMTVLCASAMVEFLALNTVIWAWDLSREVTRVRLLTSFSRLFGKSASEAVRTLTTTSLPVVVVISRSRGSFEVISIVNGGSSLDESLTQLTHAVDVFEEQKSADIREEEERSKRDAVRIEQDRAYQMSLAADQAKAAKKREQEEQLRREEEEREKKELEEQKQQQKDQRDREQLLKQLPEEPSDDCTEPVALLRFRCPDGTTLQRCFLGSHQLSVLKLYAAANNFPSKDFKLLKSYPRLDVFEKDDDSTLEELGLCPQDTLIFATRE